MRFATVLILTIAISCNKPAKLPVTEVANESFFRADQNQSFEKLLGYYQQQPYLKYTETEDGYVLYPPLSALVDTSIKYEFFFSKHPYVSTLNARGQLNIYRLGPTLAEPELVFNFKAHENATNLIRKYTEIIQEKPILDSSSKGGQSREIQYLLPEGRVLIIALIPSLHPGYKVTIQHKQRG